MSCKALSRLTLGEKQEFKEYLEFHEKSQGQSLREAVLVLLPR